LILEQYVLYIVQMIDVIKLRGWVGDRKPADGGWSRLGLPRTERRQSNAGLAFSKQIKADQSKSKQFLFKDATKSRHFCRKSNQIKANQSKSKQKVKMGGQEPPGFRTKMRWQGHRGCGIVCRIPAFTSSPEKCDGSAARLRLAVTDKSLITTKRSQ
jgi:hypothetical protein